ncbi:MAG TPA: FAD-dependent oxidoreductase [Thermomicrobiales bacterium]|nr:FAD-dependent oxidoreductase [Thermomicrobiales bacterium]
MKPAVVVVGGGIVGASVAYRLTQAGARVTLLDAGRLGGGATVVSFAWLNASNKPPFPYHYLNVSGMNEYRRLQREFGSAPWLHWSGHVEWDASPQGAERLRQKVERLQSWGYPAELLPTSELRILEPDLVAPDGIDTFASYPSEGYIDTVALVGTLTGAAHDSGATILTDCAVTGLVREGDEIVGVETAAGTRIEANVVVDCAGSRAAEIMRMAGLDLPMAPTVGMVAVSAPSAVRLRSVHHDETMNIRPDGAGRIMMRHGDFDEQVQPGTPVPPDLLDQLLARVVKVLPGLAGTPIETARVTVRPIPGDQYSAIGPVPGMPGLYLAVTHSAATMGPLLGRLVAQEVLTGTVDSRLATFRPERLLQPATV